MKNKMIEEEKFFIEGDTLNAYQGREEIAVVPEGIRTIGEGAFKACVSLKKIVLPSGISCIMDGAFKGCRKLEEIEIPEGTVKIGNYAFHRCHSLKTIHLPGSVKELGDCVFLYCDRLKEVRIPGVQTLGKQVFVNDVLLEKLEISKELNPSCICDVFTGCSRLSSISFSGEQPYSIHLVETAAGEEKVPPLIRIIAEDVLRMMELEGRCLVKFLTNLKHVEIPEGIEKIGKSCFFDKRGILSIKFPVSLKEIESRAFRNCIGLETVIFQGNEVKIHADAFKNCTLLKHIQLGEEKVYSFEGVSCPVHAPKFVQEIHRQVLGNFRISGTILLSYLGNESRVAVPEGVTRIAEEAFAQNEAIDRVILPESLEEIGAEAFRDCLLLQTIDFPKGLKRIGEGAFEHCVKLIRISLPSGIFQIEKRVFRHCRSLKEVSFGEGLREIEEQAFYGCKSLKEVFFPDTLVRLGEMAFYRCSGLNEVVLAEQTEYAEGLAFAESGIKKAKICNHAGNYGTDLFSGCRRLRTLILSEGVNHIPNKLAFECQTLKQVILPETIVSAGRNAWEGTPFLENWRGCQEHNEEGQGRKDKIFWDGQKMEGEVQISQTVQIIAGGAFYGNTKLTKVYLPDSVQFVGQAAFKGCLALKEVIWPSGMKKIEAEVFSGCISLKNISLKGESSEKEKTGEIHADIFWQEIGERAFFNNKQLERICLQETKKIGREAFLGCEIVKFSQGKASWIGERAFEDTPFLRGFCDFHQPAEGIVVFGSVLVSGETARGKVTLPEGITKISPFAFSGNHMLTAVAFPEGLEEIGEGAFLGCRNLEEIKFSGKVGEMKNRAFEKCCALTEADIYAGQAGKAVFAYCTALRRVKIEGVKKLSDRMFEGCRKLEICTADQAKELGDFCFYSCRSLRTFSFSLLQFIGKYACSGCDALKEAAFQDDACLSAYAFQDCGYLEKICLLGEKGRIQIREYAFSGCSMLKEVVLQKKSWEFLSYQDGLSENIPEMARLIFCSAMSAFLVESEETLTGYCGSGRMVKIPHGIKRIQAEVFRDQVLLEEIEIPESVEYIGARAFHGTAWMEKQRKHSPMVIVNHMLLDGSCAEGEVNVSGEIRLVCGWAFANGMKIKRIHFLSERTRVEEYAFRNCIYLEEIQLPDGLVIRLSGIDNRKKELPALAKQAVMDSLNCFKTDKDNVLVECTGNISFLRIARGIAAIGEGTFKDGNLLTEVTFPSTVKEIRKEAFSGCKWLKAVRRAEGVKTIGERAFSGCSALEIVELSENFCRIGERAFEHCTALKEILLPEGMEEIPDKAFFRCHRLRKIILPSTLKRIGKEAFAFCKNLTVPTIPEGVLTEERAFVGCRATVSEEKILEESRREIHALS